MKSAITICLVPEAREGPFVFHGDLRASCRQAAEIGFDAVEVFPPAADSVDRDELRDLLATNGLSVAAFGTGAGWLIRRLSLTSAAAETRAAARQFITSIIDLAGSVGAPAIIGSMQGTQANGCDRAQALGWLREALEELGEVAVAHGVPLLLEPLNRYETNLLNRIEQTKAFLATLRTENVRILADLFHMNIEETELAAAIRAAGQFLGHVHFADSNRQAVGFGHTEIGPVISALREIGYAGYLSAEIFPLPTAVAAAEQTMAAFRRHAS
jgi:sugar phosphate isomerase/epimerase